MKKTFGKIKLMGLAIIFTLGLLFFPNGTTTVFAAEVASGNGWTLDDAGVFTLTEDIPYVEGQPYEWAPYAEQIKEIVVAEGVTEIPAIAFSSYNGVNYSQLQKVTMSSTVKVIGLSAFADNPTLTEVYLNDGLEEVKNVAFGGAGFTEIRLPENVLWYSDVFYNCDNLVSVTIPAGSRWEGANAQFYGCDNLTYVYIEEGVDTIPFTFLNACPSLKYVWVPRSVTTIQGTPILDGACIIGYKGTVAEDYVNSPTGEYNHLVFHAIDGDEHSYGEWQTVKEATCTENGLQKRTCDICHTEQTQEITANGHVWDDGTVTQKATVDAEGIMTYTCTKCGATKTETIAKLGQEQKDQNDVSQSPKTDDYSNISLWMMLLLVSIGMMLSLNAKKKLS